MKKQQQSSDRALLNEKYEQLQERELYSDKEAQMFLRRSGVSLWRARRDSLITYRRVMGRIFYTKTDLLDFLERSKRGYSVANKEVN